MLGVASEANAFCRQSTCADRIRRTCPIFEEPDNCTEVEEKCERDAAGCIIEGFPLHRKSTCLSFAVAYGNATNFGIRDNEFDALVLSAFQKWRDVDCGGGQKPGFSISSLGLVHTDRAYYCSATSLNANTWILARPWERDPALLGYETSTSSIETGEIYDADVELNVDKLLKDFPGQDKAEVLLAVVTHEAGHFLGLAHSADPKAVMYEAYSRTGLATRALTADDIAGICAIFPPTITPESCPESAVSDAALSDTACQAALTDPTLGAGETDPVEGSRTRGCTIAIDPSSPITTLPWMVALGFCVMRVRRRRPHANDS
jgi:Matrixin